MGRSGPVFRGSRRSLTLGQPAAPGDGCCSLSSLWGRPTGSWSPERKGTHMQLPRAPGEVAGASQGQTWGGTTLCWQQAAPAQAPRRGGGGLGQPCRQAAPSGTGYVGSGEAGVSGAAKEPEPEPEPRFLPPSGAPGPPLPADPLDSLEVAEPLGRTSTWFMRTLGRVRPGNWGALALKSPLLLSACSPRSPRCAHGPDGLGSCVGDEHENVLTDLASGGAHAAVCTRVCV